MSRLQPRRTQVRQVLPGGECDSLTPAPRVDQNTVNQLLLSTRGDTLFIRRGAICNTLTMDIAPEKYPSLPGNFATARDGLWLVFLDGMRWYRPAQGYSPILLKFGQDITDDLPQFIDSYGVVQGSSATDLGRYPQTWFSYMPRVSPVHGDEVMNTVVYVEDRDDGLMLIPNGRMMAWVVGSQSEVPYEHWNMLRERAGVINTAEMDGHSKDTEVNGVPQTIRQIAQEIGASTLHKASLAVTLRTKIAIYSEIGIPQLFKGQRWSRYPVPVHNKVAL
ncbi:hypothetical protein F5Y04DRAFT_274811 [Hypomontagnella monticulosa]|nr:hypothetical protein F5Y04DRAFT_274811 [Hypomontagnella monticulosa]